MKKWKEIVESRKPPPTFDHWSAADEARFKEMLEFNISMGNTALGRQQEIMRRELFASIPSMTPAEKEKLLEEVSFYDGVSASQESALPSALPALPEPEVPREELQIAADSLMALGGSPGCPPPNHGGRK